MAARFLIGLDFGSASARGVLIDIESGEQVEDCVSEYRHGLLTNRLPSNVSLPEGFALHVPGDYLESCVKILGNLGCRREIVGVGVASTACSPLPTYGDGTPLVSDYPDDPHAYIKLWKHRRAQPFAERLNAESRISRLERISGEGILAKAEELRVEAEAIWHRSRKFLEVGDWIVWQLTGTESRSMDFACFKAMYSQQHGYPKDIVDGLERKLSAPSSVGKAVGSLRPEWLAKTGIKGKPVVSTAMIDSHAVLPAVCVTSGRNFVGVLGTSSGFTLTGGMAGAIPTGFEAGAFGAALPELWCCEAGQAAFGDMLAWYIRTFPNVKGPTGDFSWYNAQAKLLTAQEPRLLALDWFGGNRVPYGDTTLSGLLIGLRVDTTEIEIYRALVESLAFGVRSILERGQGDGVDVERIVLAGPIARRNPYIVQTISNVLGRVIEVADITHASATGAAIHAAVAGGLVSNFSEGADRYGCHEYERFLPDISTGALYRTVYESYLELSNNGVLLKAMRRLAKNTKMINFHSMAIDLEVDLGE